MQIAVITITRNNAEGLRRTIASVRRQTYADMLHIIVDGQSADDTAEILAAERRAATATILSAPPAGVYDAINRGIQAALEAGADVIGLLHAGDTYSSDTIVAQIARAFVAPCATATSVPAASVPTATATSCTTAAATESPRAGTEGPSAPDFVYGDLHYSRPGSDKVLRYYGASHFTPAMLRQGYAPPHPTLYLSRRAALSVGPYDTSFRVGGDFEMWLRLYERSELTPRYLPLDMVCMDTGGLSQRWYSRLITNNRERLRSFRMHGLPASHLNILRHYTHVIKSYICRK